MIKLRVPALLLYREVVTNMVAAASRVAPLVRERATRCATDDFVHQLASAVTEAFANAVLHAYRGRAPGDVEIEVDADVDRLVIRLSDWGKSFDPTKVPDPELEDLPESGLGLFIMRSFMDDVRYVPGSPNVLELTKRY